MINTGFNETPTKGPVMLPNYAFKTSIIKTSRTDKNTEDNAIPNPYLNPETMIPMAKDLVVDGAKLAAVLYAGAKILNTACEIATIAARAKL